MTGWHIYWKHIQGLLYSILKYIQNPEWCYIVEMIKTCTHFDAGGIDRHPPTKPYAFTIYRHRTKTQLQERCQSNLNWKKWIRIPYTLVLYVHVCTIDMWVCLLWPKSLLGRADQMKHFADLELRPIFLKFKVLIVRQL